MPIKLFISLSKYFQHKITVAQYPLVTLNAILAS